MTQVTPSDTTEAALEPARGDTGPAPGMSGASGQTPPSTMAAPPGPHGWPAPIRALRHREYRLLWAGSLVSNVGTWMQNIAKAWLVYRLGVERGGKEAGAAWLGLDALAGGLPVVLLLPFTGVMADRFDRRWLLGVTNSFNGLMAVLLAVLYARGALEVWHIVAASAVGGVMQAIAVPSNQSLLPALVGQEDLTNAVALNSIQFNSSRVLGPAVGGYVLAKLGATWSFALNALSFLAVIAALLAMRRVPPGIHPQQSLARSFRQGLAYLRERVDIRAMILLVFVGSFFAAPALTMLPALVREVFDGSESQFSALLSCFGAGAVVGGVMLAWRSKRVPTPWRAFPTLMALGLCEVVVSLQHHYRLTELLFFGSGVVFVGTMARLNTAILGSTPAHLRGRVSSFFVLAFSAGAPLGSALAGWLAGRLGVQGTFRLYGALLFVIAPLLLLGVRKRGVRYAYAPVPSPSGS